MKRALKIVGRVVLGLLLTVYVAVAVVNYSVVQSYLGTAVGHRLSQEWGGTVRIGALHAMPWDHLILNNVLLVSPDNDTIFDIERLAVHFKRFPYKDMALKIDRVYMRNGYYHLAVTEDTLTGMPRINMQYIFDHYASATPHETNSDVVFTVDVNTLTLNHVHYKMDLPEIPEMDFDQGVQIAHMEFFDIVSRIKDIHVVNDDITCRLVKMSARERSGFVVNQIEGRVHVSPRDITVRDFALRTPYTTVLADVELLWDDWGGPDYLADVRHDISLHPGTYVAMSDAAYWAPWLWGINATVVAEGRMRGTISDMHLSDMNIRWGESSMLQLTGDVRGLPDIENTVFDVDIERLRTTQADVRALGMIKNSRPTAHYALVDVPDMLLRQVDHVDLSLRVHGGWHELGTVNLLMESGMGGLHLDALLTPTRHGGAQFTAEAASSGLGLKILRTDWLSHTGFDLSLSGRWDKFSDLHTLAVEAEGQLINSVVRGRHLAPIELAAGMQDGVTHLRMTSTDSLALFDAEAHTRLLDTVKNAALRLAVKQIQTSALGLTDEKYNTLSTQLTANCEWSSLDDMMAVVRMNHTHWGQLAMNRVDLDVNATEDKHKVVRLESDAVSATLRGRFDYMSLPLIAMHLGHKLLPQDIFPIDTLYPHEAEQIAQSSLNLHAQWTDDGSVLGVVAPGLTLAQGSRLDGSYTASEGLKLVLRSDSLGSGSLVLADVGLSGRQEGDEYHLALEAQELNMGAIPLLQGAHLALATHANGATAALDWDSDNHTTQGDLMLQMDGGRISVTKPNFTIGKMPWVLEVDNLVLSNDEGLHLQGEGIGLRSDEQALQASISLTGQPSDKMELTFHQFDLQGLSDILLQEMPLAVKGRLGGRFSLYGLTDIPYFNANLQVDSCMVNRQPLGDVKLRSNWNAEMNTLNLQLAGDQIGADGWITLGSDNGDMNFTVDFDHFDLGLVAPLLSSFSSRFGGLLHGSFDIAGTMKHPIIVGEALVQDGVLQLDLTGVTYYFNDSLQFTNNLITLNDFRLRDPRGNTASVDGNIRYDDLSDVRLDLRLQTDNLLVLDRKPSEDFYGTVLASAEGTVQGPIEALMVNVDARTTPGCELTVPVNNQRQVKTQNYITFVSDQPETTRRTPTQRKEQRLNLEVDLSITPDVQLNLPMDFSELGVKVGANGSGDLHLTLSGSEEPQVLGSYEITSGTMKLSALSLISKDFTLEPGSNLNFQGSLPDARFNLSAVYSQRVNLSTLTGGANDVNSTQKYLQVEDIISIEGTLQEPTIGFDLRLPGADASVEEEVFAYIDRTSERDMLNQTVSLLAFGHFYNANASVNTSNGSIATSGSIGALNSILSDMTGVDIDVDYKMGNELTKDQLDVNISKDWGRWYLESTLGYGGESRELQTGNSNSAVIDALVGYRISPLVHLFAYNRTNTNDYTRMDLPYKQGVGLKLTKDFNNWKELFTTNKKK